MNPNGGNQPPQIDASSPPPHQGGLDPTVARFDGEGSIGVGLEGGTGINKMDIAPIRYVRGWVPFDPGTNPTTDGGNAPNVGRRWP